MRTKIWQVLSGALLLSACGAKEEVGTDLPTCDLGNTGKLEDLKLPEAPALDGLEVRAVPLPGGGTQGWSVLTYGNSCSQTSCASAVAALDARNDGWRLDGNAVAARTEYVIGTKGDLVVGVAANDAELVQLIGPIDTLAEAELVAQLKNLYCLRAGEKDGKFEVVSNEYFEICPIKKQQVLYEVTADASLKELERGDTVHENACIGRRPAGLNRRQRSSCRSPLGDHLARAAELEAVSVVAFQVLERELRAHEAPEALLERTREAARDEVEHARVVGRLARRFGGQVSVRTVRVSEVRDLESVALENALEGCVAETWGCLVGMHQARYAANARLRRAYRRIAVDEARHAQLSWDIADWAEQRLTSAALRRISSRRAQAVRELESAIARESESEPVRQVLGLPSAALSRRLFAHVDRALSSRPSSARSSAL